MSSLRSYKSNYIRIRFILFINLPSIKYPIIDKISYKTLGVIVLRKNSFDPNAREALNQLKLEISQELDAKLIKNEVSTRAMTKDLVKKADRILSDEDTFNPN